MIRSQVNFVKLLLPSNCIKHAFHIYSLFYAANTEFHPETRTQHSFSMLAQHANLASQRWLLGSEQSASCSLELPSAHEAASVKQTNHVTLHINAQTYLGSCKHRSKRLIVENNLPQYRTVSLFWSYHSTNHPPPSPRPASSTRKYGEPIGHAIVTYNQNTHYHIIFFIYSTCTVYEVFLSRSFKVIIEIFVIVDD